MRDKWNFWMKNTREWFWWQKQFFWRGVYLTAYQVAGYAKKKIRDPIMLSGITQDAPENYGRGRWHSR